MGIFEKNIYLLLFVPGVFCVIKFCSDICSHPLLSLGFVGCFVFFSALKRIFSSLCIFSLPSLLYTFNCVSFPLNIFLTLAVSHTY